MAVFSYATKLHSRGDIASFQPSSVPGEAQRGKEKPHRAKVRPCGAEPFYDVLRSVEEQL